MQPVKILTQTLASLADEERYLFSLNDLRTILPELSYSAFKSLLARSGKNGLLKRVCRGIYLYPNVNYPSGSVLYHTAARLRADYFNYLSLETVLSDAGVISQIPLNWIAIMSSGRSSIIECGEFGHIEFVHTKKSQSEAASQISYDSHNRLWRASVALALQDMVYTRRGTDLIDMEAVRELV